MATLPTSTDEEEAGDCRQALDQFVRREHERGLWMNLGTNATTDPKAPDGPTTLMAVSSDVADLQQVALGANNVYFTDGNPIAIPQL